MTRLDSSPERDSPSSSRAPDSELTTTKTNPTEPIKHQYPAQNTNSSTSNVPHATPRRPKRQSTGLACCKATVFTIAIVFIAYFWLSWTDPDEIARRQRAWDAAMEKIRGKQIVHAPRYNDQYRFRPAASPVITETMKDGRTKIRGGRPGDSGDSPPKPIPTTPRKTNKRKNKQAKSGRNKKKN